MLLLPPVAKKWERKNDSKKNSTLITHTNVNPHTNFAAATSECTTHDEKRTNKEKCTLAHRGEAVRDPPTHALTAYVDRLSVSWVPVHVMKKAIGKQSKQAFGDPRLLLQPTGFWNLLHAILEQIQPYLAIILCKWKLPQYFSLTFFALIPKYAQW